MAEAEEREPRSWWELLLVIVTLLVSEKILQTWLAKWAAAGVAFMLAALALYRLVPASRRVSSSGFS